MLAAGALVYAVAMGVSTISWLPVWQSDYSLQVVRAREAPDDAAIHADLATMMKERKDSAGALQELQRAVGLKPDSAELRLSLGELLKQTGDQTGAERELRRAVALRPKLAEAHIVLGNLLIEKGDLAGAIAECRQGVLLDPTQALAHNNLGVALQQAGAADEAESEFRRALSLQPDLGLALNNLGQIVMAQGKLDSAELLLRRLSANQPDLRPGPFQSWPRIRAHRAAGRGRVGIPPHAGTHAGLHRGPGTSPGFAQAGTGRPAVRRDRRPRQAGAEPQCAGKRFLELDPDFGVDGHRARAYNLLSGGRLATPFGSE